LGALDLQDRKMTNELAGVENDGPSGAGLDFVGLCHHAMRKLPAKCSARCLPSVWLSYRECSHVFYFHNLSHIRL